MCAMSILPFRGRSVSRRRPEEADPLLALRQEVSRVFDDFFSGVGVPSFASLEPTAVATILTPRMDVSETDNEVQIAVELPGIDEGDVAVTLDGDLLTIRGEKATERDEDERDYHIVERAEGTFLRTLRLPFEADSEQVRADFRDGVLMITIPKPKEAQQTSRRIEVHRQNGAGGGTAQASRGESGDRSRVDRAAAGDKPTAAAASDKSASDKSAGDKSGSGGQQGSTSGAAQTGAR
jgi:HSP20 family protein